MKKIAIIGGGIIGATAAYYLTQSPHDITIYDEGIGQATKASAGIISPWLSKRRNQKWYALAKDGAAFYPKLVQDLHLDESIYHQTGALIIRPTEQLDALAALACERKKTAPEIGTIERVQTHAHFPLLVDQPALLISGGAKLNGAALIDTLQQRIQQNGGHFKKTRARVSKCTNGYEIHSKTGTDTFDQVFIASGPHLKELLDPLGYHVDIRPQKGQLLAFQTARKHTASLPVAMLDGEADLIPFANGRFLLGATHENDAQWDLTATKAAFEQLTQSTARFLTQPETLFKSPYTYQIGTRAYTSDFAPFFDRLPNEELYVASGLGSSGLTTGPLIGYLVAQTMIGNSYPLSEYQKELTTYIQKKV